MNNTHDVIAGLKAYDKELRGRLSVMQQMVRKTEKCMSKKGLRDATNVLRDYHDLNLRQREIAGASLAILESWLEDEERLFCPTSQDFFEYEVGEECLESMCASMHLEGVRMFRCIERRLTEPPKKRRG